MTTIEEDYVSFETSKLLKEKGFNGKLLTFYITDEAKKEGYFQLMAFTDDKIDNNHSDNCYLAPTLQMAIKWLREEKGIAVVPIISSVLDNERFLWDVEITVAKTNETYHQGWIYGSYERACEVAIKYCLEHLI